MKNLILLFLVLFISGIAYSQNPTYKTTLKNGVQVSDRIYEFDVYIERTGVTAFELSGFQMGLLFNNGIKNGGTITGIIVPGSSELLATQVPANPNTAAVSGANGVLKLPTRAPVGAGNGTIIPVAPGLRVATIRLTNSVAFAPQLWVFQFNFTASPYNTLVSAYVTGISTNITVQASHVNEITDVPLPVELASFTANVNIRDISLKWTTVKEINNKGFEIERKSSDGIWSKVGYIDGKGNSNDQTSYKFDDKKLNTGKYNYRLKQIDYNGNFEYHNLTASIEVGVPTKFDISQNYPNPFNPTTKIDFDLPYDSKVNIVLYDISGREVKTLVNETKTAGYHTLQFNASDLSSGTYFYRIMTKSAGSDFVATKKMMLVK